MNHMDVVGVCTVGPIVFRSQTWLLRFSNIVPNLFF